MGAYGSPDVAIAGMVVGFHNDFESAIAKEDIDFGSPVFGFVGSEDKCYGPHLEIATVTLSADLVTGDTVSVTVNGTTVSEDFATDHATTMTAFIAAINADADIAALGIEAVKGASDRVVVLTGPAGLDVVATASVTILDLVLLPLLLLVVLLVSFSVLPLLSRLVEKSLVPKLLAGRKVCLYLSSVSVVFGFLLNLPLLIKMRRML